MLHALKNTTRDPFNLKNHNMKSKHSVDAYLVRYVFFVVVVIVFFLIFFVNGDLYRFLNDTDMYDFGRCSEGKCE